MSWWSAADELLATGFWLVVPGALMVLALGGRSLTAFLAAPAVSVGGLASWAVVLGWLGVAWRPWTVLGVVVLSAGVALLVRWVATAWAARENGPQHARAAAPDQDAARPGAVWAALGVCVGALAAIVPLARGMGGPDLVPASGDVMFHLSATRFILDTGDASMLTLGSVTATLDGQSGFYPAAWHGIAALATNGSVVPASNALLLLTAGLVWPAGLAALARAVAPRWPSAAFFAPLLGVGLLSFPAHIFTWGGLWPNVLSYALIPGAMALTVVSLRAGTRMRAAWLVLVLAAVAGVAIAHPNGVLVYALAITPYIVARAFGSTRRLVGTAGNSASVVSRLVVPLPVLGMVAWLGGWLMVLVTFADMIADTAFRGAAGFRQGVWNAVADVIPGTGGGANLVLVAAIVVGLVVVVWHRGVRWLVPSLILLLFFAGLGESTPPLAWLADAWYADANRLRPMAMIVSVVIGGIGLAAVTRLVARGATAVFSGRSGRRTARVESCVGIAVAVAVLAATGGGRAAERTEIMAARFPSRVAAPEAAPLASPDEIAMIETLGGVVSPGAVLLGNPFNGSALAYAIADVDVIFTAFRGTWNADARFLAAHLVDIHNDPAVCEAIDRLGVEYFYTDTTLFQPGWLQEADFAGLPAEAPQPGFDLVAEGGTARVYRITACD